MSTQEVVKAPANGATVRHEFGATEVQQYNETSAAALAAREKAIVEARFVAAWQRPRNIERFRLRLLDECKRPGFAAQAEYARPVGKEKNDRTGQWEEKIARGPTIRLIETAVQNFGNLVAESQVIFESAETRIVRCVMTDLETNATWEESLPIPKRIEKRGFKKGNAVEPPKGRTIVGQRINSQGETTFLVEATDDEMYVRQKALVSKAQRKNAERLLPSDIIEEALEVSRKTLAAADAQDPSAALRKILDAFHGLGIEPADIETWVGKPLANLQPKDMQELRAFYHGIKDGETTLEESMAERHGDEGSKKAAADVAKQKLDKLNAKPQPPQEEKPAEPAREASSTPSTAPAGTVKDQEAKEATEFITGLQASRLRSKADELGWGHDEFLKMLNRANIIDETKVPASMYGDVMTAIEGGAAPKPVETKAEEPKKRGGLKL